MANVLIRPSWRVPDSLITPERVFLQRRRFLKQMSFAGAGLLASSLPLLAAVNGELPAGATPIAKGPKKYPFPRNPQFNPALRLTDERVAGGYNNFYEFSLDKVRVKDLVGKFQISPWPIQIGGLVEKTQTINAEDLVEQFPLEERVYRFRCVEAWSMVLPWTGFPLSKLIEKAAPKSEAKFLRFETFNRPEQAPGMLRLPDYPWPYFEGLRMDEAMHPLTMVVTGIYGKPLPKQQGAPVRIVVPWKYGYKSIKSIVKIDFVREQPKTFWETLGPDEYPFESNVNPKVPHPRWSQATERVVETGDRIRTLPFNGYANEVAKLYGKA